MITMDTQVRSSVTIGRPFNNNCLHFMARLVQAETRQDFVEYTLLLAFVALASAAFFLGQAESMNRDMGGRQPCGKQRGNRRHKLIEIATKRFNYNIPIVELGQVPAA